MKQVQVRILCQVITAQMGTLNTGAIVRTDEAFAKHLVDDCGAAEYVKPEPAPVAPPSTAPAAVSKTAGSRKPGALAKPTGPSVDDVTPSIKGKVGDVAIDKTANAETGKPEDVQTSAPQLPTEERAAGG